MTVVWWLSGREAPEIELYPSTVLTVNEGDGASFECRVIRGYPAPRLTWTRCRLIVYLLTYLLTYLLNM